MPLIRCNACGNDVSAAAKTCPQCGHPCQKQPPSASKTALLVISISIAVVFVLFVAGIGQQDKPAAAIPVMTGDNLTQESWQTKAAAPACKAAEDIDKLLDFAAARDREAYRQQWFNGLMSGNCRLIDKGQKVFISEGGLFSEPCVRIRGETACWYMPQTLLEPITK